MLVKYWRLASVSVSVILLLLSIARGFLVSNQYLGRLLPPRSAPRQSPKLCAHNARIQPRNKPLFTGSGTMSTLKSYRSMQIYSLFRSLNPCSSTRRLLSSSTQAPAAAHGNNIDARPVKQSEEASRPRQPTERARAVSDKDMKLLKTVQLSMSSCKQFSYGLLCVSGGSDSVAMLHLMHRLRSLWGRGGRGAAAEDEGEEKKGEEGRRNVITLDVVHFNHKIRAESDLEAEFVKELAASYGAVYHQRTWGDTSDSSDSPGGSKGAASSLAGAGMHANARAWRRREASAIRAARVQELGIREEAAYICTAHHREDQVETVLLQLIRGSHISNMHGMKAVSGDYFKPLLRLSKSDLVDFLSRSGLRWMEDPSNAEREYKRNRVRLDLVPLLEDLAGGKTALDRRLTMLATQSEKVGRLIDRKINDTALALSGGGGGLPFCFESNGTFFIDLIVPKGNNKNKGDKGLKTFDGRKLFLAEPIIVQEEIVHQLLQLATDNTPDYDTVRRVAKMCRMRPENAPALTDTGSCIFDDDDDGDYSPPVGRRVTLSGGWEAQRSFHPPRLVVRKIEPNGVGEASTLPLASG